MRLCISIFFLSVCVQCQGQINQYQNLLDTAFVTQIGLFVHTTPIRDIKIDSREMWMYIENYRSSRWKYIIDYRGHIKYKILTKKGKTLDTVMFRQIINNCKNADTTPWQEKELASALLVSGNEEVVSKKYMTRKFTSARKKEVRFYRKKVNTYNSTDIHYRNLCYVSRPVFDNSKMFAIIQSSSGAGPLSGGESIVLYHFEDGSWKEAGLIMNCAY